MRQPSRRDRFSGSEPFCTVCRRQMSQSISGPAKSLNLVVMRIRWTAAKGEAASWKASDVGRTRSSLLFNRKNYGGSMAKTTVGLFESPGTVDEVVRELEVGGFPRGDIRVIGEPRDLPGTEATSTPRTDFEVDLTRELVTMGAAEADAEGYVSGVRRGGVIVFVTGSGDKTDAAAEIMNRHHAVEIEKLSTAEQHLPSTVRDDSSLTQGGTIQVGRFRSSSGGARLFVW